MTVRVAARAREVEELRCPLCLDALLPDAGRADCPTCGTPHHAECLDELGGCALLGCTGAPKEPKDRAAVVERARERMRRLVRERAPIVVPPPRQASSTTAWLVALVVGACVSFPLVGYLLGRWPVVAFVLAVLATVTIASLLVAFFESMEPVE